MTLIKMTDLDLSGKRVLIRSDLNVPIKDGHITCDSRICASLPTIETALKKGAYVMVASHLGRPIEGEFNKLFSLQPVVNYIKRKLSINVILHTNYLDGIQNNFKNNELIILENVRFNKGENKNDEELAKRYAKLCDIFVMDAFGTAHRAQSSTHSIVKFAPISCAGPLLSKEIYALEKALHNPKRPMVAIIGGSKVSTKLSILDSMVKIADNIIIGGGIANTFIAATGKNIGKSLYESELIPDAQLLLKYNKIFVPEDVKVSTEFSETAQSILRSTNCIKDNEQILDLGNNSIHHIENILKKANTILWNGPVGVFEFPNFREGTKAITHSIVHSNAFSIIGGGDTLAAINLFNLAEKISYISTGGGAFLEFVEGKKLPAIDILEEYSIKKHFYYK